MDNVKSLEELRQLFIVIAFASFPEDMPIEYHHIRVEDTVDFTIYEGIKAAYEYRAPRESITSHVPPNTYSENGKEADIKRMTRIHQALESHRQARHDIYLREFGEDIPELSRQSMKKTKAVGYQVNDMRYYEMASYSRLGIIKKIRDGQISDYYKVPPKMFRNLMGEYENEVAHLQDSMKDSESILFNTAVFFNLEWLYNVDIIYRIAEMAEVADKNRIDAGRLKEILGWQYVPAFGSGFRTYSRMLHIRWRFIPLVFFEPDERFSTVYECHLVLNNWLYNLFGVPLHEIISKFPVDEQAEYVKNHFWIWDTRPKKEEWTKKKIQIARQIYKDITIPKDMFETK